MIKPRVCFFSLLPASTWTAWIAGHLHSTAALLSLTGERVQAVTLRDIKHFHRAERSLTVPSMSHHLQKAAQGSGHTQTGLSIWGPLYKFLELPDPFLREALNANSVLMSMISVSRPFRIRGITAFYKQNPPSCTCVLSISRDCSRMQHLNFLTRVLSQQSCKCFAITDGLALTG